MDTRWSPGPEADDPAAWAGGEASRDPWATDYGQPTAPYGYGATPHSPAPRGGDPSIHRPGPTDPVYSDLVDQRGGGYGAPDGRSLGTYPPAMSTAAYRDLPTQVHAAVAGATRPGGDAAEWDAQPRSTWGATLLWVSIWLLTPALVYLLFAATRSGAAPDGCLEAPGAPCLSPRARALSTFGQALPGLVGTFALALPVSLGLRRLTIHWRAATVALAATVISAGAVTLLVSLLG